MEGAFAGAVPPPDVCARIEQHPCALQVSCASSKVQGLEAAVGERGVDLGGVGLGAGLQQHFRDPSVPASRGLVERCEHLAVFGVHNWFAPSLDQQRHDLLVPPAGGAVQRCASLGVSLHDVSAVFKGLRHSSDIAATSRLEKRALSHRGRCNNPSRPALWRCSAAGRATNSLMNARSLHDFISRGAPFCHGTGFDSASVAPTPALPGCILLHGADFGIGLRHEARRESGGHAHQGFSPEGGLSGRLSADQAGAYASRETARL